MDGPPRHGISRPLRPRSRGRINAAARGKSRVAKFAAGHGGNRAARNSASGGTDDDARAPPFVAANRGGDGIRGGKENTSPHGITRVASALVAQGMTVFAPVAQGASKP